MRLAYPRINDSTGETQIMTWSSESHNEEPLTAAMDNLRLKVFDWSRQNNSLLVSQGNKNTEWSEIAVIPIAAAPHAEAATRSIISDPAYHLYQSSYSPDGRWIIFEAILVKSVEPGSESAIYATPLSGGEPGSESTIYATPVSGGPWVRITDGKRWDDKPHWSPDGKMIYFVSGRSGFFNVWGIRFDPAKGKTVGKPFPVTALDSPSKMVPTFIPTVALSLAQNRLVLTVAQVSGSIWVLDHVDRQGGRDDR
jgi:Tol biopolymer transport system component